MILTVFVVHFHLNDLNSKNTHFRLNENVKIIYLIVYFGALAHLVERFVRNEKAGGSSPLCST